jgi:hypothetical protein
MDHCAPLTLWRLLPPFRKTLTVNRITVGGFLELIGVVRSRGDFSKPMNEREWCAFADLVCEGQRRGFLSRWLGGYLMGPLTGRNIRALDKASQEAEGSGGWARILGCLKPADNAEDRGGIAADVVSIAKMNNLDWRKVRDEWTMQDYLTYCETLNRMSEEAKPRVMTAGILGTIPGIGIVH